MIIQRINMEKIDILYEDNHIIVVTKPFGIPSQADNSNDEDMLSIVKTYLKNKYQKTGNVFLGLVHRLDRVTGGVMVFAKTSKAASRLSEQIRTNQFHKQYLAVIEGIGFPRRGVLQDYLYKNREKNKVYVCSSNKKHAKECFLEYTVLAEKDNFSFVKIKLITGRSHQIRVQFSSRNYPIAGDVKYGSHKELGNHIALWAYHLTFIHPTKKEMLSFSQVPLKSYFLNFEKEIEQLENR